MKVVGGKGSELLHEMGRHRDGGRNEASWRVPRWQATNSAHGVSRDIRALSLDRAVEAFEVGVRYPSDQRLDIVPVLRLA